jgi:hypothetical protein
LMGAAILSPIIYLPDAVILQRNEGSRKPALALD